MQVFKLDLTYSLRKRYIWKGRERDREREREQERKRARERERERERARERKSERESERERARERKKRIELLSFSFSNNSARHRKLVHVGYIDVKVEESAYTKYRFLLLFNSRKSNVSLQSAVL